MKKINLLFAAVIGVALLLPSLGQSEEFRRPFKRAIKAERAQDVHEVKIWVSVEQQAAGAVCNPKCPEGQICKFNGDGGAYCGKPDIVINCPDSDPLCGIEGQIPQMHLTLGSKPQASDAVCNPKCPEGQICKFKSGGGTTCGAPDIVINCPDSDPLCGL